VTSNLDSTTASRFLAPKPLFYIGISTPQHFTDCLQSSEWSSTYNIGTKQNFAVAVSRNITESSCGIAIRYLPNWTIIFPHRRIREQVFSSPSLLSSSFSVYFALPHSVPSSSTYSSLLSFAPFDILTRAIVRQCTARSRTQTGTVYVQQDLLFPQINIVLVSTNVSKAREWNPISLMAAAKGQIVTPRLFPCNFSILGI
jgi:hypothetical protein